ncbi:MAG: hypothetical protein RR312_08755, partial [Bacteroidales bacterium]
DIQSSRLLFQLVPSVRPIDGIEFGLLPTPKACDCQGGGAKTMTGRRIARPSGQTFSVGLRDMAASRLLPTPVASDHMGGSTRTDPNRQFSCSLKDYIHGEAQQKDEALIGRSSQLNPRFTLEMMGFPVNWLDTPFQIQNGEKNQSKPAEMP